MAACAVLGRAWSTAPVLPLDVSVPQHLCCPWMCLLHSTCAATGLFYCSLCCMSMDISLCLSLLQQSVWPRRCLSCSNLCFTWTYLFNSSLCCPEDGLQQLVLHLDSLSQRVSAALKRVCLQELLYALRCLSIGACAALMRVHLQKLCAAPGRVCLQEPVLNLCMSVYQSFVLHLYVVSTNASAPVLVC
jgi:hypothetical protein